MNARGGFTLSAFHHSCSNGRKSVSAPVPPVPSHGAESNDIILTLQSQVDRLWHEMRQLRAERSDSEAPLSYPERDASCRSEGGQPEVYNAV
jgi:hypothetical protein